MHELGKPGAHWTSHQQLRTFFLLELLQFEKQMQRMRITGGRRVYERFWDSLRAGGCTLVAELEEWMCEGAGQATATKVYTV